MTSRKLGCFTTSNWVYWNMHYWELSEWATPFSFFTQMKNCDTVALKYSNKFDIISLACGIFAENMIKWLWQGYWQ
jgi:hypothetical protein